MRSAPVTSRTSYTGDGPDPQTERLERRPSRLGASPRIGQVLHAVFAFAEMLEVVRGNPVRNVPPPKGDSREPLILSAEQYEALLAACASNPMLYLYVLVLGETGVRCNSEGLWLRWEDIDLERGFLTVESVRKGRRTKSGKSRVVPMTRRLSEALRNHAAEYRLRTYHGKRTPWVFHHETDRRHSQAGDRIGGLYRAFANAAKRAGLPEDLNQHDLRHRRVTTWIAEGKKSGPDSEGDGTLRTCHHDALYTLGLGGSPRTRSRAGGTGAKGTSRPLETRRGPRVSAPLGRLFCPILCLFCVHSADHLMWKTSGKHGGSGTRTHAGVTQTSVFKTGTLAARSPLPTRKISPSPRRAGAGNSPATPHWQISTSTGGWRGTSYRPISVGRAFAL